MPLGSGQLFVLVFTTNSLGGGSGGGHAWRGSSRCPPRVVVGGGSPTGCGRDDDEDRPLCEGPAPDEECPQRKLWKVRCESSVTQVVVVVVTAQGMSLAIFTICWRTVELDLGGLCQPVGMSKLLLGCQLSLEEVNPHLVLVSILAQVLDLLSEKQVFLLCRRSAVLVRWLPGDHHYLQVEKAIIERLSQSHVVQHIVHPHPTTTPDIVCQKVLIKARQVAAKPPTKDYQVLARRTLCKRSTDAPATPNVTRR
jgi:hypothetical protein